MATWRLEETTGWRAYFAFVLAGALLSFGLAGAASVGLFVLPIGVVLFGLGIAYAPDTRDRWGVLAGVGAVGVLIGALNFNYQPCGEGPTILNDEGTYSCGGFDGRPWLAVGMLMIGVSLALYHRRRMHPSIPGPV